ncbi:MAG: aldo/keto reductase, partial [Oscillospiraceae bacterium]
AMFDRWIEPQLTDTLCELGMGAVAFCPLNQGVLTDRYISGIPSDSRAAISYGSINPDYVTEPKLDKVKKLSAFAKERNQSVAQLALAWVLRKEPITSAIIGASKVSQIEENVAAINKLDFSSDELSEIQKIIAD